MQKKHSKGKWFSKQALIEFIDESPEEFEADMEEYPNEMDSEKLLEQFRKNEEKLKLLGKTIEQLSDEKDSLLQKDEKQQQVLKDYEKQLSTYESEEDSQEERPEDDPEEPPFSEIEEEQMEVEATQQEEESEKPADKRREEVDMTKDTPEETIQTQNKLIDQLKEENASLQQELLAKASAGSNDQRLIEEDFLEATDKLVNVQAAKKLSEQELERLQRILVDQELALERQQESYEDQLASKDIELRAIAIDKSRMEKNLEDNQQVTKEVKTMNVSLKKENEVLLDKIHQLEEATKNKTNDMTAFVALQKKYEELNIQYEQVKKEQATSQKSHQKILDEKETEIQHYTEQLSELKAKIEKLGELEKKCTRLEEENQLWVENKKDFEHASKQKLEEIQMALAEKEEQNNQMTVELEELKALSEEKEALNSALFDAHEEISKLEEQVKEAETIRLEKEELAKQLKESATQLTYLNTEIKSKDVKEEAEELTRAKRQITELVDKNEELKKEVIQSQQEIGEVLISAKKQANRTVEEAKIEAKHMISSAELELENISNRAKKIYIEASESKDNVLDIYEELLTKIDQLSKGALMKERLKEIETDSNNS